MQLARSEYEVTLLMAGVVMRLTSAPELESSLMICMPDETYR